MAKSMITSDEALEYICAELRSHDEQVSFGPNDSKRIPFRVGAVRALLTGYKAANNDIRAMLIAVPEGEICSYCEHGQHGVPRCVRCQKDAKWRGPEPGAKGGPTNDDA